jgi:hypothetical protein
MPGEEENVKLDVIPQPFCNSFVQDIAFTEIYRI